MYTFLFILFQKKKKINIIKIYIFIPHYSVTTNQQTPFPKISNFQINLHDYLPLLYQYFSIFIPVKVYPINTTYTTNIYILLENLYTIHLLLLMPLPSL